jgi:hypothetical protein
VNALHVFPSLSELMPSIVLSSCAAKATPAPCSRGMAATSTTSQIAIGLRHDMTPPNRRREPARG